MLDSAAVADVFLSYAERDTDLAQQIMAALRVTGIPILPARPLEQPPNVKAVARELTSAKCLIVLWSDDSVQDESVLAEADYAARRKILVSVVTGTPTLPMRYRDTALAGLTHWGGKPTSTTLMRLTRLVESFLQPSGRSVPQPDQKGVRNRDLTDLARHAGAKADERLSAVR